MRKMLDMVAIGGLDKVFMVGAVRELEEALAASTGVEEGWC